MLLVSGCLGGQPTGSSSAVTSPPPDHLRCDKEQRDECFLRVEGGTFWMGAQSTDPDAPGYHPDALPSEGPVREVSVESFWIQEYEFRHKVIARCKGEACPSLAIDVNSAKGADAFAPFASSVSWEEAQALCKSLGGRLPTAAEWEYAARGPKSTVYPWGDDPPCGLGLSNDPFVTRPRAEWGAIEGCDADKPRNPRSRSAAGVRDMASGHWEWVADWYAADAYASGATHNPTGPETGTRREQRGGAWTALEPAEVRSSVRGSMKPTSRAADVGFRCAW